MLVLILILFIAYIIYRSYQHFFPAPNIDSKGKYVLISGCDSGFGRGLAIELDQKGFHVFAGVLLSENIEKLQALLSPRATILPLDVTKQEHIDGVFDVIKSKTNVLHALVNNAGIISGGNIDWTSMETMRRILEVNFFGHVTMTKKFLPLLIAKRDSRVVNVSSMCGYISLPGTSPYCASKYALESFSDCLRREMASWNLRVSIIEPGTFKTSMVDGSKDLILKAWQTAPTETRERWGEAFFSNCYDIVMNNVFIRYAENPMKVIRALEHAVVSTAPRIRYRPGWQSSYFFFPLSCLPVWLVDQIITLGLSARPIGIQNQAKD